MSDEPRQRVVEYLIGEMTADQIAEFERELGSDPAIAQEVEAMRPVVSRLEGLPDEAWEMPDPPPLAMPAEVAGDPAGRKAGPADVASDIRLPDRPEHRTTRSGWRLGGLSLPRLVSGVAVGAALLLVGFLVGNQTGDEPAGPIAEPAQTVALDSLGEAPPGASGEVDLTSSSEDPVTLTVDGLSPSPGSEFYELWLLGKKGELVSLGSFRVGAGGSREIKVPLPVDPDTYQYFDVSIQPENGSPDHSGRSVLRGLTNS